jgi:hypothetical protein
MILFYIIVFVNLRMFNNGSHITELHIKILESIGEENVKKIMNITGKNKVSFYHFKNYFRNLEILKAYRNNKPISEIAREFHVNLCTVYRIIHRMTGK